MKNSKRIRPDGKDPLMHQRQRIALYISDGNIPECGAPRIPFGDQRDR
ncbi:MAG: hypothetical protein K6G90_00375 [Clostridia bacterium]|nr:hypothetical protein [Clostridia bacterium]